MANINDFHVILAIKKNLENKQEIILESNPSKLVHFQNYYKITNFCW